MTERMSDKIFEGCVTTWKPYLLVTEARRARASEARLVEALTELHQEMHYWGMKINKGTWEKNIFQSKDGMQYRQAGNLLAELKPESEEGE